jgi:hypothetical protein
MGTGHVDALVVIDDPVIIGGVRSIADLAMAQRLPSIGFLELAEAGGLMAYSEHDPIIPGTGGYAKLHRARRAAIARHRAPRGQPEAEGFPPRPSPPQRQFEKKS